MEGIVIKNYNRKSSQGNYQLMAKVVTDEFKENNKAVFGGIKKPVSDTEKIFHEFTTDARIKKVIMKRVNEFNEPFDLTLMKVVPSEVIKDILKEEFLGIYENYNFVDFKQFRQKLSPVCVRVIRELMVLKGMKQT